MHSKSCNAIKHSHQDTTKEQTMFSLPYTGVADDIWWLCWPKRFDSIKVDLYLEGLEACHFVCTNMDPHSTAGFAPETLYLNRTEQPLLICFRLDCKICTIMMQFTIIGCHVCTRSLTLFFLFYILYLLISHVLTNTAYIACIYPYFVYTARIYRARQPVCNSPTVNHLVNIHQS